MQAPSFADSLKVLLLQEADEGRGGALCGKNVDRVAHEAGPFMIGEEFPSVYLESPLLGDPFTDITVLYSRLAPGTHVKHPAAAGTDAMLGWFADACEGLSHVCCGFELDTKEPELPAAAVHFQPRKHADLVRPFCESLGESARGELYLDLAARMPEGWPLSFFGMFRGRPGSPLRVCGYLSPEEQEACANDPMHLARIFGKVGFTAYDEAMLNEVSTLFATAPQQADFQFDVYPDGSLGDTFAIDIQFKIEQPEAVQASFESGRASRIMRLLEEKGAADERWKLVPNAAFARAIPIQQENGTLGRFAFSLMPQWAKARWRNRTLQPAKIYMLATAGFLEE